MDELINQITQRTGISENQARQAVEVVANFIKQRAPGPIASQIDNFLGGQGAQGGQGLGGMMGQAQQGLGDILGGDRP
jgi:uncharacterized protein (DUF2267 family)